MIDIPGPDARYERKFEIETHDPARVRHHVLRHPAMFRTAYPPRWVNNLYLDTPGLDAYHDNAEGNPRRAKARIRWYGPPAGPVGSGTLEIKVKDGSVGGKQHHPMPPFVVDDRLDARSVAAMVRALDGLGPAARALVAGLERVSVNRYRREYFVSSDGRFRATIDTDLTFGSLHRMGGRRSGGAARPVVVLEIKYGPGADGDADRVCAWFPFRQARHSKYARGVEATA